MIICVNVLIYQKMISLSSMISGKSQGLKLKVKDSLKPLWTRFLSNPKRLRPTACEVCTVNSITGGVLTWSVGILQTLRCTLQFVGRVGRLAWDPATTSRQISQHVSKECQLVASDITHQAHQTHRAPSHTAPAKSEDGSLQHHRCLAQSRGTKGYVSIGLETNAWMEVSKVMIVMGVSRFFFIHFKMDIVHEINHWTGKHGSFHNFWWVKHVKKQLYKKHNGFRSILPFNRTSTHFLDSLSQDFPKMCWAAELQIAKPEVLSRKYTFVVGPLMLSSGSLIAGYFYVQMMCPDRRHPTSGVIGPAIFRIRFM